MNTYSEIYERLQQVTIGAEGLIRKVIVNDMQYLVAK